MKLIRRKGKYYVRYRAGHRVTQSSLNTTSLEVAKALLAHQSTKTTLSVYKKEKN